MPILATLPGVVDTFKLPGGIQVERRDSQIVDGYLQDNGVSVIAVDPAVVHRASGRDLLLLPEGDRTKGAIQVFTHVRLRTSLDGTNEQPDVILYTPEGEAAQRRYVVKVSEDWIAQSGHYRCLAVLQHSS